MSKNKLGILGFLDDDLFSRTAVCMRRTLDWSLREEAREEEGT